MIDKMIYIILIVAVLAAGGFIFYRVYIFPPSEDDSTEAEKPTVIETKCSKSSDCDWKPTNCCDENAGAFWECVNVKTFSLQCPSLVLCPQIISPKPTIDCSCEEGSCVVKK